MFLLIGKIGRLAIGMLHLVRHRDLRDDPPTIRRLRSYAPARVPAVAGLLLHRPLISQRDDQADLAQGGGYKIQSDRGGRGPGNARE
jgi:hypothetical protein